MTATPNTENLLSKLYDFTGTQPEQTRRGWHSTCPACRGRLNVIAVDDDPQLVCRDGCGTGQVLAALEGHDDKFGSDDGPTEWPKRDQVEFQRITSAELDAGSYELDYLVDGVLVEKQPCVMVGPQKSLKTSLLVDLAVSLARGGHFLGHFNVQRAVRVGIMSGESGLATLQETARRICKAAGCQLADVTNLVWSPDLPVFGHVDHMMALAEFLAEDELEVVIMDPAYLCTPLAADKGNNLFAMGELLRSVNDAVSSCGCTPIIAHHSPKSRKHFDPPELSDAAWSGWAEWARQWLLLNRREAFDPDGNGQHKLWFAAGGSAGHSTLIGLDVTEGRQSSPEGRTWAVEVRSASDVRSESHEERGAEQKRQKEARFNGDCELAHKKLDAVYPDGLTKTTLRNRCQFSNDRMSRVIEELLERGDIEKCDVTVSNHKKPTQAIAARRQRILYCEPPGPPGQTTGTRCPTDDQSTSGTRTNPCKGLSYYWWSQRGCAQLTSVLMVNFVLASQLSNA